MVRNIGCSYTVAGWFGGRTTLVWEAVVGAVECKIAVEEAGLNLGIDLAMVRL